MITISRSAICSTQINPVKCSYFPGLSIKVCPTERKITVLALAKHLSIHKNGFESEC